MDPGSHKYQKAFALSLSYTLAPIIYSYVMYLSKACPRKSNLMAVILLNSGIRCSHIIKQALFLCWAFPMRRLWLLGWICSFYNDHDRDLMQKNLSKAKFTRFAHSANFPASFPVCRLLSRLNSPDSGVSPWLGLSLHDFCDILSGPHPTRLRFLTLTSPAFFPLPLSPIFRP